MLPEDCPVIAPIFVSHGSPTLIFDDVPARDFLVTLGQSLPRPKAILVVSAHWETNIPAVNAVAVNETIHDFGGFPQILFDQRYPAPGDPDLAARIAGLIRDAGLPVGIDTARGLDHGAWVPLKLMHPANDIPVLQLSVQTHLGAAHHYRLGLALRALAEEGVLILGSGSFTHDLRSVDWRGSNVAPGWVTDFADWVNAALAEGRIDNLLNYRRLSPYATRNHPTEEHFLPLFVALGAGGAAARSLHQSLTFSVLRMDAFEFAA
jgi:4,5-DOPA dioxygenase extradiol